VRPSKNLMRLAWEVRLAHEVKRAVRTFFSAIAWLWRRARRMVGNQ
jgi:hypothetical protein